MKKWSKSPQTEQTTDFDDNNEKRDSSAENPSSSVEVIDNELWLYYYSTPNTKKKITKNFIVPWRVKKGGKNETKE